MQVKNMQHLLDLLGQGVNEFFISLNGGLRSSKRVMLMPDNKLSIFNYIDDTEQELTHDELFDSSITNIGTALSSGALYRHD